MSGDEEGRLRLASWPTFINYWESHNSKLITQDATDETTQKRHDETEGRRKGNVSLAGPYRPCAACCNEGINCDAFTNEYSS